MVTGTHWLTHPEISCLTGTQSAPLCAWEDQHATLVLWTAASKIFSSSTGFCCRVMLIKMFSWTDNKNNERISRLKHSWLLEGKKAMVNAKCKPEVRSLSYIIIPWTVHCWWCLTVLFMLEWKKSGSKWNTAFWDVVLKSLLPKTLCVSQKADYSSPLAATPLLLP